MWVRRINPVRIISMLIVAAGPFWFNSYEPLGDASHVTMTTSPLTTFYTKHGQNHHGKWVQIPHQLVGTNTVWVNHIPFRIHRANITRYTQRGSAVTLFARLPGGCVRNSVLVVIRAAFLLVQQVLLASHPLTGPNISDPTHIKYLEELACTYSIYRPFTRW